MDLYDNAFGRHQNKGRLVGRSPSIGDSARRRAIAASTYSRVEEKLVLELGGETILIDREYACGSQPWLLSDDSHEDLST